MRPVRFSLVVLFIGLFPLAGCTDGDGADAHGNFEAEEVTVSSEAGGQLLRFTVEEGDRLPAGTRGTAASRDALPRPEESARRAEVGLVDTTSLALQRRELKARRQSVRSKMTSVQAEVAVLSERLRAARRELERVRTLHEGDAAPSQKVDRAEDEVRVLEKRIEATRTQTASLRDEIDAINEKIAQVNERIRKSRIVNPVGGTVLETYVEEGEVVRTGEPLYKIASLDTLTLRAYVSGGQLSSVKLGQKAQVLIDDGSEGQQSLPGRVTWIADEAEFTPTPIQTKEERVDFVYAVKLRVPNPEGAIKIGMPGDVMFGSGAATADASARPDTAMAER